jgi:hypothetical protein
MIPSLSTAPPATGLAVAMRIGRSISGQSSLPLNPLIERFLKGQRIKFLVLDPASVEKHYPRLFIRRGTAEGHGNYDPPLAPEEFAFTKTTHRKQNQNTVPISD